MIIPNNLDINFNTIPVSPFWSDKSGGELKMHKIHWYPAKFPPFLVSKSLQYAQEKGVNINNIADVFCGCGTTALESRFHEINFWGCDINPVATLIAKVKSRQLNKNILQKYFAKIVKDFSHRKIKTPETYLENKRINYWFSIKQIQKLYKLLSLIRETVPPGKYREFFYCSFSNILRGTSRWLIKSIKPQVDPDKIPHNVIESFEKQCLMMIKANEESKKRFSSKSSASIQNGNFLEMPLNWNFIDLLITSPPYVTSYEYADLHQLSSLWLNFAKDYRDLRRGTIGSLYHEKLKEEEIGSLNLTAKKIYSQMLLIDAGKAHSIIKYFFDLKKTVRKTNLILRPGALAVFVIGNTSYRNVYIDNAKYLTSCMIDEGFKNTNVFKRKIGPKILTPFRDSKGKFSTNPKDRKVYNHEYVIIAEKEK